MNQNLLSSRTVAVSQNNLSFFDFAKTKFWPCKKMKLFSQNKKKNFFKIFDLEENNKKIFYMIENTKLIKSIFKKITEKKNINLKANETITKID